MNQNMKLQNGELIMSKDGLLGRLHVNDETKECEIHSISDKVGRWVVRVSSISDLSKGNNWKRYHSRSKYGWNPIFNKNIYVYVNVFVWIYLFA